MKKPTYSSCTDTGVSWLPAIPSHWEVRQIKFACTYNDETLSETTDEEYEFDYIDISSVSLIEGIKRAERIKFRKAPSRARRIVRRGDSIVSTVRTYLRAIATIDFDAKDLIVSTGFVVLRPGKGVVDKYLGYYVQTHGFVDSVVARSVGVSYPAINASDLVRIPMTLPPPDEQRQIAAFLDRETARIDALIEKKRRLLELLEEKRLAVITRAVTKGLDPDMPMKDSGIDWLGAVPAHWAVKRLKFISPHQSVGVVVNPSSYVDESGHVPFIYGANIREYSIDVESARRISKESNAALSKSQLSAGDVVVVRVGAPGVAAVVPPELDGANCASVMFVRKSPDFLSEWLCHVLNSRIGRYQVELVQYGAAQKQFNIEHAVNFAYPVPPLSEQRQLVETLQRVIEPLHATARRVADAIDLLTEYRSALITNAVTGKINVRDLVEDEAAA